MNRRFLTNDKRVNKGPYEIRITTYYLSEHKNHGIRIEVRRLSLRGVTVEIELLQGDNVIILKKTFQTTVLVNPTKVEIDKVIEEYNQYARKNKLI
ncbi:hypothetical protein [Neobacillus notoginsengisoli]|uniref:hypothetical protein n=1 Tax=Neobacillus notoginsengisoli TaxID=1578198 RepID=UPI00115F4667|nr:hypothetical protein [Neobacillus notoginsengisoli]